MSLLYGRKRKSSYKDNHMCDENDVDTTHDGTNNSKRTPDISPSLSRWISATTTTNNNATSATSSSTSSVNAIIKNEERSSSSDNRKGNKKISVRRQNQEQKRLEEVARQTRARQLLREMERSLNPKESNKKQSSSLTTTMLHGIQSLRSLGTGGDGIHTKKRLHRYRLVWAGSDDAISYVGSGLHKVPLARLDDIFITFQDDRLELVEIIRILGPFPNVCNTLRGTIIFEDSKRKCQITYDTMIDGTGKVLSFDTNSNNNNNNKTKEKVIYLTILYWDESSFVCSVATNNDNDDDDFKTNNGEKILFFLQEEEMELKLKKHRIT